MRNGYGSSLFPTEDGTCYVCGYVGDTARHEIIHGANRSLSKKLGLWIAVCPRCHDAIHREDNGRFRYLKESAEERFLREYNKTIEDFIALFGRNYL